MRLALPLSLVASLSVLITGAAVFAQTADVIYHGGDIVTVDDKNPTAEALAVQKGKIVAVGRKNDVLKMKGAGTKLVDLEGKTLVPGFIDGHCHFFGFGAQAVGANLLAPPDHTVNTIDDLIGELNQFAAGPDVSRTGWIFGVGYDDAVLAEKRHPTRDDLDKVSTEIPVIAIHISGHIAAVNTAGLKKIGYTAETRDPEGGRIRRRSDSQEPNGVLEEMAAIPTMLKVITPATAENQRYFISRGQELAVRFGYTTAQEGRAMAANHTALSKYADQGLLKIDVVSYIDYADRHLIVPPLYCRTYQKRYRIGGMKVTLDGSPQGRTAWRTRPYLLPPDGQKSDYAGYPAIPNSDLVARLYEEACQKNWQVLTHANGDAAIDQFLATIKPALDKHGLGDRRHTLIHGQFIRQDQLDGLQKYKIIPSLFPMHTFYWGDWYDQIIGPEFAQQISPLRSARDRGMIVTSHTDAPVALPNLTQLMWSTVTRTSRSGQVMGPKECLTPLEALKCVTLWGAYQHFEEQSKGSLEVGKLADLVILSKNPLTVDPMAIKEIQVVETIKEGTTVFRKHDDRAAGGN